MVAFLTGRPERLPTRPSMHWSKAHRLDVVVHSKLLPLVALEQFAAFRVLQDEMPTQGHLMARDRRAEPGQVDAQGPRPGAISQR